MVRTPIDSSNRVMLIIYAKSKRPGKGSYVAASSPGGFAGYGETADRACAMVMSLVRAYVGWANARRQSIEDWWKEVKRSTPADLAQLARELKDGTEIGMHEGIRFQRVEMPRKLQTGTSIFCA